MPFKTAFRPAAKIDPDFERRLEALSGSSPQEQRWDTQQQDLTSRLLDLGGGRQLPVRHMDESRGGRGGDDLMSRLMNLSGVSDGYDMPGGGDRQIGSGELERRLMALSGQDPRQGQIDSDRQYAERLQRAQQIGSDRRYAEQLGSGDRWGGVQGGREFSGASYGGSRGSGLRSLAKDYMRIADQLPPKEQLREYKKLYKMLDKKGYGTSRSSARRDRRLERSAKRRARRGVKRIIKRRKKAFRKLVIKKRKKAIRKAKRAGIKVGRKQRRGLDKRIARALRAKGYS